MMVNGNLTLGKKAQASEYVSTLEGQANKKDFSSIQDFIDSIRK